MKNEITRYGNGSSCLSFGDGLAGYRLTASPVADADRPMTHFALCAEGSPDGAIVEHDVSGIKVQGTPDEKEFAIVMRAFLRRVDRFIAAEKPGKPYRDRLEHLSGCMQAALQEGIALGGIFQEGATAA